MEKLKYHFFKSGLFLWILSVSIITVSFFLFSHDSVINLVASIIGVTAVILNAKGKPAGQVMMIVFSLLYGIISLKCAYYGEMITYLFMTAPMAVIALMSWIQNPYGDGKKVEVNTIKLPEIVFMLFLAGAVTISFYFILKFFNTANLLVSTFSVMTSFMGAYLSFRRSAFFSLAYVLNDIVLIILWGMASVENTSYISVVVCFSMFLVNDVYGFVSWRDMEIQQFLDHLKRFEMALDKCKKL